MISPPSLREWIAIVLIPILALVFRELAARRTHRHTEKVSATDTWLSEFNAIRNEWKESREEWSHRIERAEAAELECEQRCAGLEIRVLQVESDRVADREVIHQQRERITVLELEIGLHDKRKTP